jgi:hypothetical protein
MNELLKVLGFQGKYVREITLQFGVRGLMATTIEVVNTQDEEEAFREVLRRYKIVPVPIDVETQRDPHKIESPAAAIA